MWQCDFYSFFCFARTLRSSCMQFIAVMRRQWSRQIHALMLEMSWRATMSQIIHTSDFSVGWPINEPFFSVDTAFWRLVPFFITLLFSPLSLYHFISLWPFSQSTRPLFCHLALSRSVSSILSCPPILYRVARNCMTTNNKSKTSLRNFPLCFHLSLCRYSHITTKYNTQ